MSRRIKTRLSVLGRVKLSSRREALFALRTCCYMARIKNSGSTSAAQHVVGRSLTSRISLSMRDVPPVGRSSVERDWGGKNLWFGENGVRNVGVWGLESWRAFCGGARVNSVKVVKVLRSANNGSSAARESASLLFNGRSVRSNTVLCGLLPSRCVVGSVAPSHDSHTKCRLHPTVSEVIL